MSLLNNITGGKDQMGIRAVIYGQEKMGKTTIAASAPRPLLIPLEKGYGGVDINKVPLVQDFGVLMGLLTDIGNACQAGQFQFQTLIFDSGTALEQLIHNYVIASDPAKKPSTTMESALGGFGKAYSFSNDRFHEFTTMCDNLAYIFKLNIIVTCHAFAAKVVDPTAGEYDCWDILLHSPKNQKTYGKREMITQWADVVGFLHEPLIVSTNAESGMTTGVSLNKGRVLGVSRTPSYVAGNRYGLSEPIPIPEENGWNAVAEAIQSSKGLDYLNKDISEN